MPKIHVVGAAIIDGDRCLAAQRSSEMSVPLKWEFPGGKVRDGETPEAALEREILEELGVTIQVADLLGSGSSSTSSKKIRLDVYTARLVAGDPHPHEHSEIRWVSNDELGEVGLGGGGCSGVARIRGSAS